MSERIDHAEHSQACLDVSHQYLSYEEFAFSDHAVKEAQVHATLARVEQQRIANLIALANFRYQTLEEANSVSNRAFDTLFNSSPDPASPGNVQWLPSPDIAAALGVES